MAGDHPAIAKAFDLTLDRIDPNLQPANLAIIVVAIAVPVGRVRQSAIHLRRGWCGDGESRGCGGERNQNLIHHGSPYEQVDEVLLLALSWRYPEHASYPAFKIINFLAEKTGTHMEKAPQSLATPSD
jgi:hypothetical protein